MSSSKVCYFAIINFIFLCMQTSAQNVVEDNRDSLLFITVESVQPTGTTIKETGTGFIIDEQGFVLTAAHLLTSDPNATVYGKRRSRNSPEAPMQLEFITFGCSDLALLKIPRFPRI
jgi:S1-C subfamily serine protease